MKDRELWLFTTRYPQGITEPFLENELPVIASRFGQVRIFPLLRDAGTRDVPSNTTVTHAIADPYHAAGPVDMLLNIRLLRDALYIIKRDAPSLEVWERHRREVLSRLRQALHRMLLLRSRVSAAYDPGRVKLYSYWTADWATVLALWRMADPAVRFVSRMHGFDLYADRSVDGWPPFRTLQLQQVERVYVASQAGLDHLVAHHPAFKGKFELARLGTRDHNIAPWRPSPVLRIVSCSNIVELKRVHVIAESLKLVTAEVEWTHFGDGPDRDRVEAAVRELPPNVRAHLMGAVPNAKIMEWYGTHPVDLFLHLSSSEGGVPVALQEAASFGIPLMACDAGGVREIVNDRTGLLLPVDPLRRQIAQLIDGHPGSVRHTAAFREGVRRAWSGDFRAEAAFGRFADRLLQT